MRKAKTEVVADEAVAAMNAHALRIWEGQSISLSLKDRVERIKAGLVEQGHAERLSALVLPAEGFEKYL